MAGLIYHANGTFSYQTVCRNCRHPVFVKNLPMEDYAALTKVHRTAIRVEKESPFRLTKKEQRVITSSYCIPCQTYLFPEADEDE